MLRARASCHFSTSEQWSDHCAFLVHFELKTCFAPQRPAIFSQPNCQKWSGAGVFCAFWVEKVLRATAACNETPAAVASLLFDPPDRQIIGKTQKFPNILRAHIFFLLFFSLSLFYFCFLFFLVSAFRLSILSGVLLLDLFRLIANSILHMPVDWKMTKLEMNKTIPHTDHAMWTAPKITKRFN